MKEELARKLEGGGELCEDEGGGAWKPDQLHKTINIKGR
jgi:hypothetical protein